jgi:hypothetical protein
VLSFDGAERAARELVALAITPASAPRYTLASRD